MAGWAATRDAIHAAIAAASGLGAGRIFWQYQDGEEPQLSASLNAAIALHLGSSIEVGTDSTRTSTDLTRAAGQEIEIAVVGVREVALQLEVFTFATVAATGKQDAIELAEQVRTALTLPGVRALFAAQGVVPFGGGRVGYLPEIVAVGFRGRATLDVRCYWPAPAAVEYAGYIASLHGTVTAKGTGGADVTRSIVLP